MNGEVKSEEQRLCYCTTVCCLHAHADLMLKMLYRYADECADCGGDGEIEVGDAETGHMEPCERCKDIRELIKLVDPCGDRLERAQRLKREAAEEPEDDVAF